MAVTYQPIEAESFKSWDDIKKAAKEEEEAVVRIPIKGLLQRGAEFLDDEYFGDSDTAFRFNENGIRSLCSSLGVQLKTLDLVERQGLVTDLLNDLLAQRPIQDKLSPWELIVNEESNEIIGLVSESYTGYSNYQLIEDVEKLLSAKGDQLSLFSLMEDFDFQGGCINNTQLSLRFTTRKEVGVIRGKSGGPERDETNIGFQFKNSMVGNSSANINYYLKRKVCSNGMVVPAGSAVNKVFHSGKQESLNERLVSAFSEMMQRIGQAQKMVEQLGALEFDPELLARTNRSEMIFDVIQGSKSHIINKFKIPNTPREGNKKENKVAREAKIIGCIPETYAGKHSSQVFYSPYRDNASMFDFINIFTEHAKELDSAKKIEAEEKAGVLADWIARNKRKFKKQN